VAINTEMSMGDYGIAIQHASSEWRGGTVVSQMLARQERLERLSNPLGIKLGGFVPKIPTTKLGIPLFQNPMLEKPELVRIPEVRGQNPWYDLDRQIQPFMTKWRWRHWQRHPVEREYAGDEKVAREKNEAQANITRAIQRLAEQQLIVISGVRKNQIISLNKNVE
jgi:hypothetical protein